MNRLVHRIVTPLVVGSALACGDAGRDVVVRVAIPGFDSAPAPVPETPVLLLPYDRDSLRDAMAAAAPSPRPTAAEAELDSLFRLFREPFSNFVSASADAGRLEDSAASLESRLAELGPTDPARAAVEQALADLRSPLAAARADRERARSRLDEVRTATGDRVDSLRAVVRLWENTAFAEWASEVEQLGRGRREPRADTTGPQGIADLTVPGGAWWVHATAHDPLDPNARWYWNIPVPAETDTIELTARTGTRRPRY